MTRDSLTVRPPRAPLRLRTVVALTFTSTVTLMNVLPLRRRTQAIIADVLSQSIAAGMDLAGACDVAAQSLRGFRPRR